MQLSPLQSRLAASVIASCLLLAIYLFLLSPQFALAAELSSIPIDHETEVDAERWNPEQMLADGVEALETLDIRSDTYEPVFAPFDRSIMGRAQTGVKAMVNNAPVKMNLEPSSWSTFVFEVSSVSGRDDSGNTDGVRELRRELNVSQNPKDEIYGVGLKIEDDVGVQPELAKRATKTLWISANTCIQPEPDSDKTTMTPPQLTLFVSTSKTNTSPGPLAPPNQQEFRVFDEGAVMWNTTLSEDVYFTVSAPNVSTEFSSRFYNVEIAASVDQSYHSYGEKTALYWVDSDANATLLMTGNLTNSSGEAIATPPYTMFAYNQDEKAVVGVRNSFCGLKLYAQIGGTRSSLRTDMMRTGMTTRGQQNATRQEFYFNGLNSSTSYTGILAREPGVNALGKRDGAGGGGAVFNTTQFSTKDSGTCTIIYNLTFCDQTAYAVPGNTSRFADAIALASFYDDYAKSVYDNFNKAMQQIPCDTGTTAKYSLVRGCSDCKSAYKDWLCSIAIPRCEDFSKMDKFLQMRNINALFPDGHKVDENITAAYGGNKAYNSSRVPRIDDEISPGPYKEVLPCDDLCYNIVQSCPSSLGFSCPVPGMRGFNNSYGHRAASGDSNVTCNFPGSAHIVSRATILTVPWVVVVVLMGSVLLLT
ncbi:calcium influx-promoting protein ehs1 [Pseudomassariella vexata]|uniref:Calcium influx-promoting protein ehs1 n=1 Tax=Pseudomassariella vexata TaxID=1141098 RepID=A0A1Y2EMC3_9PEZI|nr:calcium influx-promoting protein ehs1 [Pseudomassariella vexata]ORY71985.1 calcium influx-promoting protein ehs1 [Pseudomassariella vexata]